MKPKTSVKSKEFLFKILVNVEKNFYRYEEKNCWHSLFFFFWKIRFYDKFIEFFRFYLIFFKIACIWLMFSQNKAEFVHTYTGFYGANHDFTRFRLWFISEFTNPYRASHFESLRTASGGWDKSNLNIFTTHNTVLTHCVVYMNL